MNSIISRILTREEFIEQPLVFVDIGASGGIHSKWRNFAKWSTCIAYDPDSREFSCQDSSSNSKLWNKLYLLNRIVSDNIGSSSFYLTSSPYCSSTLLPDEESLETWAFAKHFSVVQEIKLPTITLIESLNEIGIGYIDWLKTDTQGTDLRIFSALPNHIRNNIIVSDFEPGIIDAYHGEDKLVDLMKFMDCPTWWVSSLKIKGSQRIHSRIFKMHKLNSFLVSSAIQFSPGWGEIQYMNSMTSNSPSIRSLLAAWLFSFSEGQYGHSLYLCYLGQENFNDPIFDVLTSLTINYFYKPQNFIYHLLERITNKIKFIFSN